MSVLDHDGSLVDDRLSGRRERHDANDATGEWIDVCAFDDLVPDRGVCALVGGEPVAIYRCLFDDELFAISNIDPYSDASVLSRGIVGSVGERPVVTSPLFKNRFDLRTGASLDDPMVSVPVYRARVERDRVVVRSAPPSDVISRP